MEPDDRPKKEPDTQNGSVSSILLEHLKEQQRKLEYLSFSTARINNICEDLTQYLRQNPVQNSVTRIVRPPIISCTKEQLLDKICYGKNQFTAFIKLETSLQMPLYKERAFEITANLMTYEHQFYPLAEDCYFKIQLFTTEVPPRQMKISTSGAKIIRGSKKISLSQNQFNLYFPRVVFKQVTSHFKNGWFFLVVLPSLGYIEPLIIEEVVIKARRMNKEPTLPKKRKTDIS